ncbi:MAG: GNAT family N-acetyltransferase [Xanthobacteraceae bacterium]
MPDTPIIIRDPSAADEMAWRELWSGYNAFYEVNIPEAVTAHTWHRLLDPASSIFGRLAITDGEVAGFSLCIVHDSSWTIGPYCYLEDFFVAPRFRGRGCGRSLIRDLMDRAKASGFARLYWHTRANNPARRLYDEFAAADDFVRYRLSVD